MKKRQTLDATEAAVETIRKRGDTIGVNESLRRVPVKVSRLLGAAALGASFGFEKSIIMSDLRDPTLLETALPYVLYAPLVIGGMHMLGKTLENRNAQRTERAMEVIQATFDEPVDIFREDSPDKEQAIGVRWYGFDDLPNDARIPADFMERSRNMLKVARQYELSSIACRVPDDFTDEHELKSGAYFLQDTRFLMGERLRDNAAAPKVLHVSLDNFEKALDEYEIENQPTLLDQLVGQLGDRHISELYERYQASGKNSVLRARLSRTVRDAIEMNASETDVTVERRPDGTPLRQKVHGGVTVQANGLLLNHETGIVSGTGESKLSLTGRNHLASLVGYRDNQRFLNDLTDGNIDELSKQELLVGIQLLIDTQLLDVASNGNKPYEIPAFWDVLQSDNTAERFSLHTNKYIKGDKRFYRGLGGFAAVALGAIIGTAMSTAAEAAWDEDSDRATSYYAKHHADDPNIDTIQIEPPYHNQMSDEFAEYKNDPKSAYSPLMSKLYTIPYGIEGVHNKISLTIADFLVEDLNMTMLEPHLPAYMKEKHGAWAEAFSQGVGSNPLQADETSSTGDVNHGSGKDRPHYSVESLTGVPTAGYWAADEYDNVWLNPDFGGTGAQLGKSSRRIEQVFPESDSELIAAAKPDMMIETPYLSTSAEYGTKMPIRSDTVIVGAQIIDEEHPSRVVKPQLLEGRDGTYELAPIVGSDYMLQEMAMLNMEKPILRYYLKIDPSKNEVTSQLRQNPPTQVEKGVQGGWANSAEIKEVASAARRALSLPNDASAEEVIAAIKQKDYSYTPLADAGIKDIGSSDDNKALVGIADTLARLDSMNCNVASLTALIATSDMQPNPVYAQFTGYYDGNEDGVLSGHEAHAWLGDIRTGVLVDPTPAGTNGVPPVVEKVNSSKVMPDLVSDKAARLAAEILLAGASGAVATTLIYRRRRQIAEKIDTIGAVATLALPGIKKEILRSEHELYADPAKPFVYNPEKFMPLAEAMRRFAVNQPEKQQAGRFGGKVLRVRGKAIRREAERRGLADASTPAFPASHDGVEILEF